MQEEIVQVFAKLVEIDSPSLGERRMAEQIKRMFGSLGIQFTEDSSSYVTGSDSGNLYAYVPVKYIKENRIAHRNLELLFTTGEELYCKGAKAFDCQSLKATSVYVPDLSGDIGTAAYAAPTILSFQATIKGAASHAGFAPENGINAIAAGADAIASLEQGRLDENTTANIGTIQGGEGINIVSQCA